MSVSRFDQAIGQGFTPMQTYVPLPLQQLTDLAMHMQKKKDTALDDISKVKDILKFDADPRNIEYRDNYLKKANQGIEDITDRALKEGWTSNLESEWNRFKNHIVTDPNRLAVIDANKNYLENQKDVISSKKAGTYHDMYDDYKGEGDPGQPTPYIYNGMKTKQDYIPIMDKAIEGIKSDSRGWENYLKDKNGQVIINEYGQLTKSDGTKEKVSYNKLQNVAKLIAPTFFQSKESQYYIDEAFGQEMPEFNKLPEEQQNQLIEMVSSDMIRRGWKQTFEKSDSGTDLTNLPKHVLDNINANQTTSSQSEALSNSMSNLNNNLEFNKDGSLKSIKVPETTYKTSNSLYNDAPVTKNQATTEDTKATREAKELINSYRQEHSELRNLTDKQVNEAVEKAHKSLSSESIPLNSISGLARKNIGEGIADNKIQRNFYLWDSKGKTEDGTLTTVLDKLGIEETDFDKALRSGIGGYTQAGPNAGSYYVEVKDDNGRSRRVMISPDSQMQSIFKTSQAVNEARKSLKPFEVEPIQGYKVVGKPNISKDGSIKWQYIEVLPNGKIQPTSLDEIRKQEREALKESNYLGSQVQDTKDEEKDIE